MDKKLVKMIKQNHKMLVDISGHLSSCDPISKSDLLNDFNKFSK